MYKKLFISLTILILSFSYGEKIFSQEIIEGKWQGALTINGMNLRIVFNIKNEDGKLTATMDSPDQGAKDIPTDTVLFNDNKVRIEAKKIAGFYEGTLQEKSKINGTWSQGGSNFVLNLEKVTEAEEEKNFISLWEGNLKTTGVELKLFLKIFENKDGSIGAFLDSPDQGVKDLPINEISFPSDSLIFTIKVVNGRYEGEYEDSLTIVGEWTQMGSTLPLTFNKTDKISEAKRPQTPKEPYPYKAEEVTFKNEKENIKLAGTLTLPEKGDLFTGVILITGSGAQDRDESIFNHRPFLVLADYLTRNGLAVLRYDDRGTAASTGNFSTATSEDLANDVLAAVDFLKSRKEIKDIGLIGHSEGGLIAPMVSVKSNDVKFIVLLAGPGVPGDEILLSQAELIYQAENIDKDEIEKSLETNRKIYDVIKSEKDSAKAVRAIKKYIKEGISEMKDEEKKKIYDSDEFIEQQLNQIMTPWFRNFVKYDPQPILKKVDVPVLAITGEKDLQVPPEENLKAIEEALKEGENENYKVMKLEELNHMFQTAETGAPSEYGKIEETFSPKALKIIYEWINGLKL